MNSILDSMNDQALTGKIDNAIQRQSIGDSFPIIGNVSDVSLIPSYESHQEEEIRERIFELFDTTGAPNIHHDISKRNYLEEAINLIEEYSMTDFDYLCRGLVYFPDLLERYLKVHKQNKVLVSEDDIGCMISRCIEHPNDIDVTYATESMKYLLDFKGKLPLEIKLLPGKYHIDESLYELAKSHNVHDSYYDRASDDEPYTYSHLDVVAKERKGIYTGFRDAYHCLIYGERQHLQALIVRWDLWGDDCTADAAREYFNLNKSSPIEAIMACINKRCMEDLVSR